MKSFNFAMLSALFVLVLTASTTSLAARLEARVTDVHDGDTLTAVGTIDSKKYKIRLMGVDTPEIEFFQFNQGDSATAARDALRAKLPKGTIIELSDDSEIDKHGRVLGIILRNGVDLNQEMLREGWGFLYFIYPFEKRLVNEYSEAAREGIENKQGLFSANFKSTEEPYLFRLRVRKQVGRNLVGDLESKKLYEPQDIAQIPLWRRVFFSDAQLANQAGYK